MREKFFWVACLLALILVAGCARQNLAPQTGFLTGKVSIGPLCPVERFPPDPRCQPTPETFKAWPLAVYASNHVKVAALAPQADGAYKVELPAGEYVVDLVNRQPGGLGARNLPAPASVRAGETTPLDVDIDTGIR